MENKEFIELLEALEACEDAIEWVGDRDWKQVYQDCERGDWIMWFFRQTNPEDYRLHELVAGYQAKTVNHLMSEEWSEASETAIDIGEGKIRGDGSYAWASGVATWAAARVWLTTRAKDREAAYDANLKETADIFRSFVPIEKFNIPY